MKKIKRFLRAIPEKISGQTDKQMDKQMNKQTDTIEELF